ncbi:MAG TPA: hypothetical protein VGS12_14565 [Caulobacteraceae bacterium]|nr:hypothetical protein [Caulobacteraceae bacterium]
MFITVKRVTYGPVELAIASVAYLNPAGADTCVINLVGGQTIHAAEPLASMKTRLETGEALPPEPVTPAKPEKPKAKAPARAK